jgi:HSP20 family protein
LGTIDTSDGLVVPLRHGPSIGIEESLMSILRWHPLGQIWNEFDQAHNEMNRFLHYVDTGGPPDPKGEFAAFPPLNVSDDNDNIYVEAELPGITLENLEITIADGNRLTLKGQRKPAEVGKTTWHRQERSFGSFSRTLTLPVLVDSDRVEAHFELGNLRVTLPKSPKAKPRRIEVEQNRSGKQNHKKGKKHEYAIQ